MLSVFDLLEMLLPRWLRGPLGQPEPNSAAPPSFSPRPNASPTPSPAVLARHRRCATSRRRWQPPTPAAPNASPTQSPTTRSKAQALSEVAAALAATEPDRAARLFTEAERIANSITNESWKALALSERRGGAGGHRPRPRRPALRRRRTHRQLHHQRSWKASALSGIAKAVAATDPDRAERIANSITNEFWRAAGAGRVAAALAATDPDHAARLLADAERIANSITDASSKASALRGIAEAMAAHATPAAPNASPTPSPDEFSKARR